MYDLLELVAAWSMNNIPLAFVHGRYLSRKHSGSRKIGEEHK